MCYLIVYVLSLSLSLSLSLRYPLMENEGACADRLLSPESAAVIAKMAESFDEIESAFFPPELNPVERKELEKYKTTFERSMMGKILTQNHAPKKPKTEKTSEANKK